MKKILSTLFILPACLCVYAQTTVIKYLSGTGKDHTVQWDFYCTEGQNSGKWTKIAVPSNWEQQGFGNYNYGQDKVKANEQGLYKYRFNMAPGQLAGRVILVFEGSMTDTEVKINGKSAGDKHQGSFYRFKYDITPLLKSGENLLEATVSKTSANASVNHAERNGDFWIFGGIYRPVYLEIVPKTYVERVAVDARADGTFHMDVFGQNLASGQVIEAQVQTLKGENVGKVMSAKAGDVVGKSGILPDSDVVSSVNGKFDGPKLWSAEFPNLYQVVVSVKNKQGIVHQVKQKFGFRTVELRKNDGFYINGAKILFKGCDRHSFWPESARTLSHAVQVLDGNLLKEMNMNAVRMSHYPPDADFIDVCDSLGIYVLDEVTGWHAAYDTIAGHKIVKEMVCRDVSHPSVVIWDNGNEGGWNVALDNDYAMYDPQKRIVIHPWAKLNGTNTKHYPDYAYMLNSVATEQDVFFPTEFMHGLYDGGAGAALDDFWDLIMKHPHGAGGFIWAFLDEAVMRSDRNGAYDSDGNHAPDGIVGPHREKEASFFTIKEIWSPVYVEAPVLDKSFGLQLKVENRYSFTNFSQCSFSWKLLKLPSATAKTDKPVTDAFGNIASTALAPGQSGTINLPLPAAWPKSDALYFTAYGPDKKELFTWTWPIPHPAAVPAKAAAKVPAIKNDDNILVVDCGNAQYYFDKKTGYIQKIHTAKGDISLSGGPVLAGVNCELKQFSPGAIANGYQVEAGYEGANGSLHVKWTFATGQPAKLDYTYNQQGEADYRGITFNYPEDKITGIKWLGRGPYRAWKNRLKGQQYGVWHKNYNNSITGETWGYPEFKGYHAEVQWVTIENKEAPFTISTGNPSLYLQLYHPAREKDALKNNNVEPAYAEGDIGFLNAIAPIGTKFQPAKVMGPQSQKNAALTGPVSGTLWFSF